MTLYPRTVPSAFIHLYRVANDGRSLSLVHKTPVNDIVLAMTPFQGLLLVGVGKMLRLYDFGKRKLLRKSEFKGLPTCVQSLHGQADRIYAADLAENFHFLKYKKNNEKQMYLFAENTAPRHLTCSTVVDFDTVAGGDKFGNIAVSRLPTDFTDDIEDTSAASISSAVFNNNTNKLVDIAHFYVGESITSICKTSLMPGGSEVLLYSTISGSIGALAPLRSRDDVDFFSHLEMHMRQTNPSIVGRDHLAFRSYYFPVKSVVDGDLCEQFATLEYSKQKSISEDLARSQNDVAKKLEEIRNRVM
eukprot:TRINITY_DN1300_c0_g1_i2.p1 TRINITY_DN1300_c0_g1~~TRINITY_DN1300_c0_g1_i2.p1  ORF type:complete len:319 (+),score=110.17 TRINITY_DN1300_c0_g1_i2:51-959(+)